MKTNINDKLTIGLIHATMNSYQPISNAFLAYENQVELINFMDEGVLYELRKTNQITNRMVVRLAELAWKAVETGVDGIRSEEHTSELQSRGHHVCRLLLEKKKE